MKDIIKDKQYGTMKFIGNINNMEIAYAKLVKRYDNRIVLDYSKIRIYENENTNLPLHIVDKVKP